MLNNLPRNVKEVLKVALKDRATLLKASISFGQALKEEGMDPVLPNVDEYKRSLAEVQALIKDLEKAPEHVNLLRKVQTWSANRFPNQTRKRVVQHLREEQLELFNALDENDSGAIIRELADNVILLCALAQVENIDLWLAVRTIHKENTESSFEYDESLGYDKKVKS